MRILKLSHILFSVAIASLASCYSPPDFDNSPSISFSDISFVIGDQRDTLKLSFNFQDGDGDLGLAGDEVLDPYNLFFFLVDENGAFIHPRDNFPGAPSFSFPNTCTDWIVNPVNPITGELFEEDTFLIAQNPNHYNIDVDWYVKRNGGFELFDWRLIFAEQEQCSNDYYGRFPILGDVSTDRPIEGTLTYKMEGTGFLFLLRNDTIKLGFRIRDRALNESNYVETPEFMLLNIQEE